MSKRKSIALLIMMTVLAVIFTGCGGTKQDSQKQPTASSSPAHEFEKFSTELPSAIKTLKIKPVTTNASIDQINNLPPIDATVKKAEKLSVVGWVVDKEAKAVPPTVVVLLLPSSVDGKQYYAMAERVARPDVAQHFNRPAYEQAGFSVSASIQDLNPGQYSLIVIQADGKKAIAFNTGVKINIQ